MLFDLCELWMAKPFPEPENSQKNQPKPRIVLTAKSQIQLRVQLSNIYP